MVRALTDTFPGIRSDDVPGFVVAQCAGALLGYFASALFIELQPDGAREWESRATLDAVSRLTAARFLRLHRRTPH